MHLLFFLVISYIIGSIPTGFLLIKFFRNIDIRTTGSNSTGATNVLRSGNKILALTTLIIDVAKGYIIVLLSKEYCPRPFLITSFVCIIAHIYPVWLKFRGGKGVSTMAGVFLALSPGLATISILTWAVVAKIFKISSLASISLAAMFLILNLYMYMTESIDAAFLIFSIAVFALISFTHASNIKRLIQHTEPKTIIKKK
ncbi:MAG: glycerol-3-phosphate 1-O-acyltransferase PlsY [Alphaproteobacteria bacterium]|nr:glycerol-3-phosphate 1-O-acyltransferase PlsY [Alphaproteobacteria bacterium]